MDDSSEEALLTLTASLFKQALACAEYFENKCGSSLGPPRYAQVVREFVFVFIHFIDRYTFEMYGHEKRCRITDAIVALLGHLLLEDHGKFKATEQIGHGITVSRGIDPETLNSRNAEYARFPSGRNAAEAEETWKRTTLVLARHLCQVVRGIPPPDFKYFDLASNLLGCSLDALELEKRLALLQDI
jgi:hypothetical protein